MGTVIGSFVGGILAICVAFFIYTRVKKKIPDPGSEKTGKAQQPQTVKTDPQQEQKNILQALVNLNIDLRTTYNLDLKIGTLVEENIDLLTDTVPQMMDRYPSESLTYELKRIAGEHLPRVVKEFFDLSAESRDTHAGAFQQSLSDIRDQVKRAKEIVEHNEVAEFKVMASFLKTKYSSEL